MKLIRFIFFSLAISISTIGISQLWPQIDSVEFIPSPPVAGSETKAVLHVTMGSTSMFLGASHTIVDSTISIEACYLIPGWTAITEFADTINLGVLSSYNYQIDFTAYGSISEIACDYTDTSNYSNLVQVQEDPNASVSIYTNEIIKIYPNPTNTFLIVEFENEPTEFKIYNSLGIEMKVEFNDFNNTLDCTDLPKGMYLIVFEYNSYLVSKRFVRK